MKGSLKLSKESLHKALGLYLASHFRYAVNVTAVNVTEPARLGDPPFTCEVSFEYVEQPKPDYGCFPYDR